LVEMNKKILSIDSNFLGNTVAGYRYIKWIGNGGVEYA